jgi:hypothetical protein
VLLRRKLAWDILRRDSGNRLLRLLNRLCRGLTQPVELRFCQGPFAQFLLHHLECIALHQTQRAAMFFRLPEDLLILHGRWRCGWRLGQLLSHIGERPDGQIGFELGINNPGAT